MPTSPRLRWRRLDRDHVDAFHRLVVDPHVRRFLLDGEQLPREWSAAEVTASDALFDRIGLGLWLLAEGDGEPIGFAGFRVFDELGPEPQLLYAFTERVTGRGLATEAARALIAAAEAAGLDPIHSAVDGPNAASLRVLAKVGFSVDRVTAEGAFGEMVWLSRRRGGA
ncbi:MAG: GNAT family N-acetyltransferase [bacterium]